MRLFYPILIATVFATSSAIAADIPQRASWQQLKNQNIVKQDQDYSCGSASMATILTYFYNQPTTEKQVIDSIGHQKQMASFKDLANVATKKGFIGRGINADFNALKKLKIPAIVYLVKDGNEHFSVLKTIDSRRVYLADPSFGNISLTHQQFKQLWQTKDNTGKILLVLPKDGKNTTTNASFTAVKS